MISIILNNLRGLKKSPDGSERENLGVAMAAAEELLFWGGLVALAFGTGVTAVLGAVGIALSLLLALLLLAHV